jgi:hypothetical protein
VALSSLADHAHDVFGREGRTLFRDDPWAIRDAYGVVVGQDGDALLEFVREQLQPDAPDEQLQHARRLLELERATLRMFTSCAWFFDEVERIETRQVLRYAARALELSGMAARLAPDFVHWLEAARGSAPGSGTASELFVREALPHRDAAWSVAAGAMACASQGITLSRVASFDVSVRAVDDQFVANVRHRRTGRAAELAGTVFGAGAATTVSLSQRGVDQGASHVVPVYEFPESVIVTLLTPLATDELALA